MGLFDTITESLCGQPDPNTWRPLPCSTFFSEGWNEAWVPSPNGSGGAPRQGWINAQDGNLYRLWFFTFAQSFNNAPRGNGYLGSYTLMAPLSRRAELIFNIPFYVRNNAVTGLPIIDPNRPVTSSPKSYSGFGDISITPRFLLHETKDFSLTAEVSVLTPTGTEPIAGKTAVTPAFGFWNNFADGFVIRGGLGLHPDPAWHGRPDQSARHRADHNPSRHAALWRLHLLSLNGGEHRPPERELDQRDADPWHPHAPGKRLVFPGRITSTGDQRSSRRDRYDLLVHEGVVSRGESRRRARGQFLPPGPLSRQWVLEYQEPEACLIHEQYYS